MLSLFASAIVACHINGRLPDPKCTPGIADVKLTQQLVCSPSFRTSTIRNVPQSEKAQVFKEYGVTVHSGATYEVDHLISLELGGSNDLKNLWPEAAKPVPGFHEKDTVENRLHAAVCAGKISLAEAQRRIVKNWMTALGAQ